MDDKAFCTWWTGGSASDADNSRESLQEQSVQGSTQGQSANEGKNGACFFFILQFSTFPAPGQSFFSRCFGLSDGWSGLAWRAAETFNIDDLKNENGVTILLDHLESELEQ